MPRRFLNRNDDLQLDLRQGSSSPGRVKWMQRAQRQQRLHKPLNQLGARGVWVPNPPPRSQGAVVKLWSGKPSGTKTHASYLSKGKGQDGVDAELYDKHGQVIDRQAFIERARADSNQLRGMVSLDAGDRADLKTFATKLIAQMERDVDISLDVLFAIHRDTANPHVHFIIRGGLPNGEALYLTKSYWAHGLRNRARTIATEMIGRTPSVSTRTVQAVRQWLHQRSHGQEMSHG